jgi:hypothetical protein
VNSHYLKRSLSWCKRKIFNLIPSLFVLSLKFEETRKYASYTLVVFIVSVYFIVPVAGYGALLAILGFSCAKSVAEERAFVL